MKKIRVLALVLVLIMAFAAVSVSAEGEFIRSIQSYTSDIVTIKENVTGNPDKDIVAEHYDAEGNLIYEVERIYIWVVDSNDKPTDSNEEALERIEVVIQEITAEGGVAEILPNHVIEDLKSANIDTKKLAVGIAFDVTYSRELKDNEILVFSLRNPAFTAMQSSDTYTGKIVVMQQNTETNDYELLQPSDETPLPAGHYKIDGDVITIAVNHLCVFMVAAESIDSPTPGGDTTCRWWLIWWIWVIIAAIILLIFFFIILAKRRKDDDEEEEKKKAEALKKAEGGDK